MNLEGKNIVITGAAGGIGTSIATRLAGEGAKLALLDRDESRLQTLSTELGLIGRKVIPVSADLLDAEMRKKAIHQIRQQLGSIDVLINTAGLMSYRPFAEEDPVVLERIIQLNTIAPMMLSREVLPDMLEHNTGHIVNIGSTFGSIGFSCFSAYSASKFGLRGFSEALRRELGDSNIKITYVAPRAVKTRLNSEAVYQMAKATKMHMDDPDDVAGKIVEAIKQNRKDVYLGFPESFFVRINALFPRLVDKVLHKQNRTLLDFAKGENS